jgi:hypothetical protein
MYNNKLQYPEVLRNNRIEYPWAHIQARAFLELSGALNNQKGQDTYNRAVKKGKKRRNGEIK